MDHAKRGQVEPERQGPEPIDQLPVPAAAFPNSIEEGSVLVPVLFGMGSKELALVVLGCEGDGVQLVVSHHRHGTSGVDHASDQIHHLELLGAPIDEVSDENGLAVVVPPCPTGLPIAELSQQSLEGISVAVDVTYYVEHFVLLSVGTIGPVR